MGKRRIGNLWEVIDLKQTETFLCIDLKSFYASVECVERGLDPFTTNLVVADPDRSVSTICLAITPAMKKLGICNRCRIHEIPDHIEYIVAKPRMQLYAIGINNAAVLMVLMMLPAFLFAMYEKDGMHLEDVLMHMIRVKFIRPSVRKYETENYYESDPDGEDQKIMRKDERKGGKSGGKKKKKGNK